MAAEAKEGDEEIVGMKEHEFHTFLKTYQKFVANPLSLRPVFNTKPYKTNTKSIYVVSHSRIMQCAIETFDMQGKLHAFVEKHEDFDFEQNVWTLELNISDRELLLYDIYNGIPKPEANKAQQPGSDEPGTIIDLDKQCNTLDKSVLGKYAYDKLFGERLKYDEGTAVKEREPFFKQIHKYEKENYLPAEEYDTTEQDSICIYVTRHANSCNNIQAEGKLAKLQKKFDPSLSDFGYWSLTGRPDLPKKLRILQWQRQQGELEPVYVSCCIRTWMTAILIYGGSVTYDIPFKKLNLLVSPYIKEKGNDPGNIPDSIPEQLQKLEYWFDLHEKELKEINVDISILTVEKVIIPIYKRNDGENHKDFYYETPVQYSPEHKTFYADGILKFSKFIYNFNALEPSIIKESNSKYNSSFTKTGKPSTKGTPSTKGKPSTTGKPSGGKIIIKKTKSVKKMKKKCTSKLSL